MMSNPVALCTHVKTNGIPCGSPAMGGTELCYHHSTVKTALGRVQPARAGVAAPIPFLFGEDRASMQINFFLLLQALNERRVDLRTYNAMLSILKSMAKNLGKSGSLVAESSEPTSQKQDVGHPRSANCDQDAAACEPVDLSAAAEKRGKAAKVGPFSMGPDYGFLPSAMPPVAVQPWEVGSGSDPIKEMARQAARVRW